MRLCFRAGVCAILLLSFGSWPVHGLGRRVQQHGAPPRKVESLGVRKELQLFAKAPIGDNNSTVMLTIWLRRMGGGQAGPFALPHQSQDGLRGFLWVEDPIHPEKLGGPAAHAAMPIDLKTWQPRLRLLVELAPPPSSSTEAVLTSAASDEERLQPQQQQLLLNVTINTEQLQDASFGGSIRPISFHVELPPGAGDCFKLMEASYPEQQVVFCASAQLHICSSLAPPGRSTDTAPALWAAIGPLRDYTVAAGGWQHMHKRVAVQLHYYLSYHLALGLSGLLLYGDQMARTHLSASPLLAPYFHSGTLRLVSWELMEKHSNQPNHPYNGYNWDQALVTSHVLLGLSACGPNLAVLITDIDEYLHIPSGGGLWPQPAGTCMGSSGGSNNGEGGSSSRDEGGSSSSSSRRDGGEAATAAMYMVRRYNIQTTAVRVEEQPSLWVTLPPPTSPSSSSSTAHPLQQYNLIDPQPLPAVHSKRICVPAFEIVSFFVHEGWPLHGKVRSPDAQSCIRILHVVNLFHTRSSQQVNATAYAPLSL